MHSECMNERVYQVRCHQILKLDWVTLTIATLLFISLFDFLKCFADRTSQYNLSN